VCVTLKGGAKLEKRVLEPKGEAANPMSDADLESKFRGNCGPLIGGTRCDDLLNSIWHFEHEDLPRFLKLLARA
jgi:2-methylcitrate dehydratase